MASKKKIQSREHAREGFKWYEILPWIILILVGAYQYISKVISAGGNPSFEYIAFDVLPAEIFIVLIFILFTLFLLIYAYFILGKNESHGIVKKWSSKIEREYSKTLPETFNYRKFVLNLLKLMIGVVKLLIIYGVGAVPFVYLAHSTFIGIPTDKLLLLPVAILSLIFCYRLASKLKMDWADEIRSILVSFLYLGLISAVIVGYNGKPVIDTISLSNITLIVAFLDLAFIESGLLLRAKEKWTKMGIN